MHVIDDNIIIHRLLEAYCGSFSREVCCFLSGEEYLVYLHSTGFQKPSIVLCDIRMPGINGHKLVLEIRKQLPFQKIVQMGSAADVDRDQLSENQICNMLDKPFRYREVIAVINALIACEDAQKSEDVSEYLLMCEFGLNHTCPFHESKRLQLA
ncbi:MAG: response regulator [Mariprofundaceae bacterium]|nr:response regulator [Mariprofundaceae bacterium]